MSRLGAALFSDSRPRICVPVCETSLTELPVAVRRAARQADLVEVRLDYLPESDYLPGAKLATELDVSVPLILTLRPTEQGGRANIDLTARRRFWSEIDQAAALFDWELDLVESIGHSKPEPDWSRIVCSYHDFQGIPPNLDDIFARLLGPPASIVKLAITAHQATDCLVLPRLLAEARMAGKSMIAIAMGGAGTMSRVLGPAWGSLFTYASSQADRATAPGQLTVDELRDRYRIGSITRETALLGIIGWPVSHSWSPMIHNAGLAALGLDSVFLRLPVSDCATFLKTMVHPRTRRWPLPWRGVSVTAPHKRTVMEYLDHLDPVAEEIGAVNTIVVQDGKLYGGNTDAKGFANPLLARLGNIRGARCAVIGAGGAARAAVWALQRHGALTTVLARHPDRARLLGREFAAEFGTMAEASFEGFDVVVNATPVGMRGKYEGQTVVTSAQLKGARLVYDLVYNPTETAFLRAGREAGCESLGGLEMLVAQAAEQFKLWNGVEPPVEVMKTAALKELNDC